MAFPPPSTKDQATTSPTSQVSIQLTPQGWLPPIQPDQPAHHSSHANPKLNITIAINMDSLTPPHTPRTQSPTLPHPPNVTHSFPLPTTLSPPTPHPSLTTITSHIEPHFLSSWPGLASSPKAAANFKKSKIALYTALVFPDEGIEEEKLAIVTEIVAMVILVDDWLDTVGEEVMEEVVRGLEEVYDTVFGLEDDGSRRTVPEGESDKDTSSNINNVADQATNTENDNTSGQSNDAKAIEKRILSLHGSLWRRLIAMSPLFASAIGKAHLQLFRAQTSSLRGTHTRLNEYLAFRYDEAGMKVAEVAQYFLVGAKKLAEAVLAEQERCCGTQNGVRMKSNVAEALQAMRECEVLASKHLLLINDVVSYDRELKALLESQNHTNSNRHDEENSYAQETEANGDKEVAMVSAIPLMMKDFGLDSQGAKAVIWTTVRQIERCFKMKRAEGLEAIGRVESGPVKAGTDQEFMDEVKKVLLGLEARMAGSEQWHYETGRYCV